MRILVAIPSVSFSSAKDDDVLWKYFEDVSRFKFSGGTLDVFFEEFVSFEPPSDLMCINVPHWPLVARKTFGIAGPGSGNGELFVPTSLKDKLGSVAGVYDKWRPYPAKSPLSSYSVKMARRFARKRYRMLQKAANKVKFHSLFYVEHSPMSIAHLSEEESFSVAREVIRGAVSVWNENRFVDLVIFSPYGIGKMDGFVVSNRLDPNRISDWESIRKYLKGELDADIRGRPGN